MINVELVLASRNEVTGDIIYTFKQRFPRIILAEVNTHTIAAKNAASSRAIPTMRQIKGILDEPFVPVSVGQYQKGMQAGNEIKGVRRWLLDQIWRKSRYFMVLAAYAAHRLGAPKQFSNRLIEPWTWTEQLWTSTDVENELMLRAHPMAEPHYEILARQKKAIILDVKEHFNGSSQPGLLRKTQTLKIGEWHLPFVNWWEFREQLAEHQAKGDIRITNKGTQVWNEATSQFVFIESLRTEMDIAKAVSSARCAWVSYYMPGDNSKKMSKTLLPALLTYYKLAADQVRHLSPLMHVATPLPFSVRVGSHCGWMMFRKELEGEAGGDKVVPSITPEMAKQLLADYKNGAHTSDMIARMSSLFEDALREYNVIPSTEEKSIA